MELERSIVVAIKNLSNQFRRYMASIELQFNSIDESNERITDTQGRIISYLYTYQKEGKVFQRDLEKHFNIRRSTATTILKRIEKNGFISRGPCPNYARMKVISLTDKAKRLCPKAHKEFIKAEKRMAKGLSREEVDQFFRIVNVMVGNIA